jgi:hypothetical protein
MVVMNNSPPKPKPLPMRIPRELVERIDRLRGLIPREAYLREVLERAIAAEERKAEDK